MIRLLQIVWQLIENSRIPICAAAQQAALEREFRTAIKGKFI